jgi:hypothetical protein
MFLSATGLCALGKKLGMVADEKGMGPFEFCTESKVWGRGALSHVNGV